jgi:hypothetical protein
VTLDDMLQRKHIIQRLCHVPLCAFPNTSLKQGVVCQAAAAAASTTTECPDVLPNL